jgi:hypothetical protein
MAWQAERGGYNAQTFSTGLRRVYWVHAVWVLNLFLFLVIAWWIFYRWSRFFIR